MINYRKFSPVRGYLINLWVLWGKNMTKRPFAVAFTFLFILGHIFKRRKNMQKSPVWKGFLSESMWIEDYGNLTLFKKLVFWLNYPFSYTKYLWVVIWDHIDRLHFKDSGATYIKTRIGHQKTCKVQ